VIDYRLEGSEQVKEALDGLADDLRNKAIRAGLVKFAAPVKSAMKSNAPRKTGALAKAVGHRSISKRDKSALGIPAENVAILVGPNRRGGGKRALWQEEGTSPHIILPRNKGGVLGSLRRVFGKKIKHPGIRPTYFMKRSWESASPLGYERFYQGLTNYLARQK